MLLLKDQSGFVGSKEIELIVPNQGARRTSTLTWKRDCLNFDKNFHC